MHFKSGREDGDSASQEQSLPLIYPHPRIETVEVGGVNVGREDVLWGAIGFQNALGYRKSPLAEPLETEFLWSLWQSASSGAVLLPGTTSALKVDGSARSHLSQVFTIVTDVHTLARLLLLLKRFTQT